MKTMHTCISIRGVLEWPRTKQKQAAKAFSVDGKMCGSVEEMRDALYSMLAQGHEVMPLGTACEGFDKVKGCPGHERTEAA